MSKPIRLLWHRTILGLALAALPARAEEAKSAPAPLAGDPVAGQEPAAAPVPARLAGDPFEVATESPAEKKGDELGMDCEAPEFSFKRLTPRTFLLFVKSKKEGHFILGIKSLSEGTGAESKDLVVINEPVLALPDPGKPVDVFFKSLAPVFAKGGRVRVVYESVGKEPTCSDRQRGFQIVTVLPQHQLDFDAGWIYNLEKDGRWDPSGDFGFSARSHLTPSWTGMASFHFAAVGKIDTVQDTGSAAGSFSNPFDSRAGSLVLNLGLELSPFIESWKNHHGIPWWFYPRFVTFGGGFSTPPGEDVTDLRPRLFAGLGIRVDDFNINGASLAMLNTTGCVRILYAYDRFYRWEDGPAAKPVAHNDYHRFIIEGELEIPGIGGKDFKPAVRGYVDVPMHKIPGLGAPDWFDPQVDGAGPAESSPSRVSISLLAHVDVQVLEKLVASK